MMTKKIKIPLLHFISIVLTATVNLSFWGDVGIHKARNNFKDAGGSLGLKYNF